MRLARAQSAARATEDSDEEEDEGREEREEVARVRYNRPAHGSIRKKKNRDKRDLEFLSRG